MSVKFYGNGIVRLPVNSGSLRFSKPDVRYQKGVYETDDPKIISQMISLGYEYDGDLPKPEHQDPELPVEPETPETSEKSEMSERDVLAEEAVSLGIDVKGTWGVKKLTEVLSELSKMEEVTDENGND